jgi:hypothetical protein
VQRVVGAANAGVVEGAVQSAERPDHFVYRPGHRRLVGDVAPHGESLAARLAQLGGQRRDPVLAPGGRRDDGAFGREPADGGRADAAGRSRDQNHPAQQALADEGERFRLLIRHLCSSLG